MALLEVDDIDAAYRNVQVLWDVSHSVAAGETVALLGANSGGKTTVLKTICGPLSPESGEVRFKGESIGDLPQDEGRRARHYARTRRTRNLRREYGQGKPPPRGIHQTKRHRRVDGARLQYLSSLDERAEQRAGTLSGGEQQMLAIGRGLMSDPDLVLLDEASLGLAPVLVEDVFEGLC